MGSFDPGASAPLRMRCRSSSAICLDGLAEGLVYNQFLVRAEQPLLMHTGMRTIIPDVAEAVGRLIKLEDLQWISGAHASRPDEFGAVNDFLAAAPKAQVVAGK
ncbi:MAG: hypothetical protein ACRDTD_05015, partial [Pseudonocardiaceae bacterium]